MKSKKLLVILLSVAMVCMTLPMSAFAGEGNTAKIKATVNGSEKVYHVGEAGDSAQNVYESDFKALETAIKDADSGSTVFLESDLTLNQNKITIDKDLSIDLQNHTITAEDGMPNQSAIFTVKGDVKLSGGTMVANSGRAISAGSSNVGEYKLEISGMTIQSKSEEAIYVSNNMVNVTIKNSNFSLLEGATAFYIINTSIFDTDAVKNYTIENSTFDASSAVGIRVCPVQINAVNANIKGCTFKSVGTNAVTRDGTALYIFENGTATVSDSTFISETASGKASEALNISWKSNGTFDLNNNIFGSKIVLGNNNNTYTVNINGSKFNTSEPITVNTKIPTLNINKAYFVDDSIKNTSLLDATHPIMSNTEDNKDEYPYVVALRADAVNAICYVPSTDTFYQTIEEAKIGANGSEIQLLQDITLDDFSANINAKGYTVTTTQSIASQLSGIKGLSNAKLVGINGEINNVFIENGKIVRGNPSDSLKELAYSNLHADSLIDSDNGEIKSADAFVAKIGNYGYTSLVSAITVATKDDAENPVQETITLLKDVKGSADIYYNKSSFILDLNGFTLGGENVDNGVMIAGASEALTPNDCNIVITDSSQEKTGKIVAKNYGVVTNGSLTGITLKLDGITVESASIGVYFPSNASELTIKDSTIKGNTGLAIKGGTVNLIDTEIYADGEKSVPTEAESSGVNETGDAIYIEGNYQTDIQLNIQSGKYYSENGFALQDLFVEQANVAGEIESGSFSSNPDENYLADSVKTIIKISDPETPFVVGTVAEEVLANLTTGDEVELVKADSTLTLPDGVTVKNSTGHDVTVNDTFVADGNTGDVHTHTYENGKCTVCGAVDPNYRPTIPTAPVADKAVDDVKTLINAIKDVTLEDEEAINIAREAYNKLTDAQKAKVDNYKVLTDAESALEVLKKEAEITEIKGIKLVARSKNVTLANGKKAIRIQWYTVKDGVYTKVDKDAFDKVIVYRAPKKGGEYKKVFTSKTGRYYNTAIKKGSRYFYKVRGVKVIDGKNIYTGYSLYASRVAK